MVWACPVCGEALKLEDRQAFCNHNHRFDQAKQGYFNLLLANQKHSKDPGDTREMMLARRDFLGAGFYRPLADHLAQWLRRAIELRALESHPDKLQFLDSGCGEGYYLDRLSVACDGAQWQGKGLDISREAAKLAARSYPEHQWAVASSFKLPLLNDSFDICLRIFAPGDDAELRRVLKPGTGEFWRVAPGPDHLKELKARLYASQQSHKPPAIPDGFQRVRSQQVRFDMALTSREQIDWLLQMTPFVWQAPKSAQDELVQLESLTVTADFLVEAFTVVESGVKTASE